jgi:hypothetical protein
MKLLDRIGDVPPVISLKSLFCLRAASGGWKALQAVRETCFRPSIHVPGTASKAVRSPWIQGQVKEIEPQHRNPIREFPSSSDPINPRSTCRKDTLLSSATQNKTERRVCE